MQFDWVNFQQCPQTLQFQQYGCAVRHSVGGIACDIRGKLAGRESCTTTHSTAAPLTPGGGGHEKSGLSATNVVLKFRDSGGIAGERRCHLGSVG